MCSPPCRRRLISCCCCCTRHCPAISKAAASSNRMAISSQAMSHTPQHAPHHQATEQLHDEGDNQHASTAFVQPHAHEVSRVDRQDVAGHGQRQHRQHHGGQ